MLGPTRAGATATVFALAQGEWLAAACALGYVFELRRHVNPGVLAVLIDRDGRRREARVRKGADCQDNKIFTTGKAPVDRRSTARTEVKSGAAAFVADTDIFVGLTLDLGSLDAKACLGAEHAPSALLTSETVANGYSDRLIGYRYRELTAATRCEARGHDDSGSGGSGRLVCRAAQLTRKIDRQQEQNWRGGETRRVSTLAQRP